MNYIARDSDLATIVAEASLLSDETTRAFGRFSGEQLNWKPREGEWSRDIPPAIIEIFADQQARLLRVMQASRALDLDRITITSPVLRVVTYSLMDACRIIVVHEQNHFVQARRVMDSPGFPDG
jgi:hypothetical protein